MRANQIGGGVVEEPKGEGRLEEMLQLCNFYIEFCLGTNYGTVVDESQDEADRIIMINRPQTTEYRGNKIRYFHFSKF